MQSILWEPVHQQSSANCFKQLKAEDMAEQRKPLMCSYCDLCFTNNSDLNAHLMDFHGRFLPFVCTFCGKGYQTKTGLIFHMNNHEGRTYACPICSKTFSRMFAMKRHMKLVHKVKSCPRCNMLLSEDDYANHILSCVPSQTPQY